MAWLVVHMWFWLLGAFLLGLLLGWWIWRCRHDEIEGVEGASAGEPAKVMSAVPAAEKPAQLTGAPPVLFTSPSEGPADDLKKVRGIGPGIEKLLNGVGIFYYRQIADWNDDHVTWIDRKLQFPGRITRENWIDQAKILRDGGNTEFAQRYEKGETPSSYVDGDKNKTDT